MTTVIDTEVTTSERDEIDYPDDELSWWRPVRYATVFGTTVVVMLGVLVGWLGIGAYQANRQQNADRLYVETARQGAVNLTTIDWQRADADVQRILDGATGQFHDDFAQRSQPFVDAVRQSQAVTVGSVTEAGLESVAPGSAQVLVSMTVKTSNAAVLDPQPRAWRMRIHVQQVDGGMKVSNVEFVP